MAKAKLIDKNAEIKTKTMHAAVKLFLERGYTEATVRDIANEAGVNVSAMVRLMKSKEALLCELVEYILEGQFEATARLLKDVTEDKLLFYAAETTLQLYMTESNEHIRELYATAYSLPESSLLIMRTAVDKREATFGEYLPELDTKDFYELEIASGGIMRGFMTVPCDMYFSVDRKVRRFLEASLRVYRVPEEKIEEAVNFVARFDYPAIARDTVDHMPAYLQSKV